LPRHPQAMKAEAVVADAVDVAVVELARAEMMV
jgi:hypothetical protein